MRHIDQEGMAAATRLTRQGRLSEATSLIQRLLARGAAASATPDETWSGPTIDLVPDPEPAPARGPAPSPAPGPDLGDPAPAAIGRWLDGSYANPFGERPYKLYVPARRPDAALPLVVMLHGCTQSPDDFALGTGMNRQAEASGLLVVYPGQVESANRSRCWNWFQPTDQEREQGEPSLIAGITRQVMREHAVDVARVYVAGLSAGGAKAAIMAARYPDLYAALAVHSGLADRAAHDLPSALLAMRGRRAKGAAAAASAFVPTLVVHGMRDRTVHPGNARAILSRALELAPPLEVSVEDGQVPGGHRYRVRRHQTRQGRTLVEDWQVQGLGHAWSGGDPRGTYTDPRGPDATRAIVDFFQQQRRAAPA